jgi:hypothetical protein
MSPLPQPVADCRRSPSWHCRIPTSPPIRVFEDSPLTSDVLKTGIFPLLLKRGPHPTRVRLSLTLRINSRAPKTLASAKVLLAGPSLKSLTSVKLLVAP